MGPEKTIHLDPSAELLEKLSCKAIHRRGTVCPFCIQGREFCGVAGEWLNSCSGCEIAILDMGEHLLGVLNLVDLVHLPALMDHTYFGRLGV